jgi:predicted 3-demethylubiquinone-9 3-methyltransferase (glyoxalase superfamily)
MATISLQKITPCLWFDKNAEEAVRFYVSVFKKSKVGRIARYGKEGFEIHRMPEGTVLTVEFRIEGQSFLAMNGGPLFTFNEAVSFTVYCKTQKEIDYYWGKLSAGGDKRAQQCGWLKDKYGVSWQIVPDIMPALIANKKTADKVMAVVLKMKKPDLAALKKVAAA